MNEVIKYQPRIQSSIFSLIFSTRIEIGLFLTFYLRSCAACTSIGLFIYDHYNLVDLSYLHIYPFNSLSGNVHGSVCTGTVA